MLQHVTVNDITDMQLWEPNATPEKLDGCETVEELVVINNNNANDNGEKQMENSNSDDNNNNININININNHNDDTTITAKDHEDDDKNPPNHSSNNTQLGKRKQRQSSQPLDDITFDAGGFGASYGGVSSDEEPPIDKNQLLPPRKRPCPPARRTARPNEWAASSDED